MRTPRAALSRICLTALIAAACLFLLWIFTAGSHAYLVSRTDARAGIGDGSLSAFRSPVGEPPLRDASFLRGPTIDADASGWIIDIPFSNLALICLLVAAAAWLAALRIKRCACHTCGYDRRGLSAGELCPECGEYQPFKLPTA